jgi:hypothetical protein
VIERLNFQVFVTFELSAKSASCGMPYDKGPAFGLPPVLSTIGDISSGC